MKLFKTDSFDGLIETLLTRFESDPYSLTQSELDILTWFSKNQKPLEKLNKEITYKEVLKSIKNRDKSDKNRKISPLKKTKDSLLINTTNLNKRACFLKIKKIIDRKINN